METPGFSFINTHDSEEAVRWYRGLDISQKIFLKSAFGSLCGIGFSESSFIFSLREKITIMHTKLKIEGLVA
jgi:hypothetical protein